MLSPDLYIRRVLDLDLDMLADQGIDTLLLDLDNTLLPRDTNVVPDEVKEWAARIKSNGVSVCLVSNNWHERVTHVADELGFDLVSKAVKPLPFAFLRGLKKCGSSRSAAAVVGDQLFTDVLGGKLLGMRTVLVLPLSASDLPHTLMLRRLERVVLGARQPVDRTEKPSGEEAS
jgi:HAD superfamily phosphatase (TIGR01668 family)